MIPVLIHAKILSHDSVPKTVAQDSPTQELVRES